jgi:hypothetical protein
VPGFQGISSPGTLTPGLAPALFSHLRRGICTKVVEVVRDKEIIEIGEVSRTLGGSLMSYERIGVGGVVFLLNIIPV